MIIQQFGKKIKIKYPQYNDMPDEELGKKMLAKYPQYNDMINSGLDDTEIQQQIEVGKKAEEFLKLPWYKQIFTTQFAKEVPGAIANVALGTTAKVATSLATLPQTFKQGYATEKTYKIPGLAPFQTYQTEAQKRGEEIVAGKKPLYYAVEPFIEVPLAIYGMGKTAQGLFGDITLTGAKAGEVQVGTIPRFISNKILQKQFNQALDATKEISKTIPEKTGTLLKGEAIKSKIPGGGYKQLPNEQDIRVAGSSTGIVNGKDAIEDIKSLQNNVAEVSEKTIKPFLEKNSYYLGKNSLVDLESRLMSMEEPSLVYTEATLEGAKQKVVDTFMKTIQKNNPETTADLWEGLKETDRIFQNQFGDKNLYNSERMNAVKSLYLDGRKIIQDFIIENTPAIDNNFKYYIDLIHDWKIAETNIAIKNAPQLGASWFKLHPLSTKIMGTTAGGGTGLALWNWLRSK